MLLLVVDIKICTSNNMALFTKTVTTYGDPSLAFGMIGRRP